MKKIIYDSPKIDAKLYVITVAMFAYMRVYFLPNFSFSII